MTVYEREPDVWDLIDHGFRPWIFAADTSTLVATDEFPRFRYSELCPLDNK